MKTLKVFILILLIPILSNCTPQNGKNFDSQALFNLGQTMVDMDNQRINRHNRAVDRMKQNQPHNIYDKNGRYWGQWR